MSFASPYFFGLLIFLPILWFFWWKTKKKNEKIQVSVLDDLQEAQGFSIWAYREIMEKILISVIIILFIVVLARPQEEHIKETIKQNGVDIIVAMDISMSMLAEDLKPNRIEAAKKTFEKFIDQVKTDRVGIVIFAGKTFTQSPLTFDYSVLKEFFRGISITSINQRIAGLAGTAIGDAVFAAINKFQSANEGIKEEEQREKVLILLTDGEANTGFDPLVASEMAKKEKIKIYTIGIGSKDGVPLPITDQFGRKTYARNNDGTPFLVTFDEETLQKIAANTGGYYFHVQNNQTLEKVLEAINKLEKKEIETEQVSEYTESFFPWLIALFINLSLFLALKWKKIIYS